MSSLTWHDDFFELYTDYQRDLQTYHQYLSDLHKWGKSMAPLQHNLRDELARMLILAMQGIYSANEKMHSRYIKCQTEAMSGSYPDRAFFSNMSEELGKLLKKMGIMSQLITEEMKTCIEAMAINASENYHQESIPDINSSNISHQASLPEENCSDISQQISASKSDSPKISHQLAGLNNGQELQTETSNQDQKANDKISSHPIQEVSWSNIPTVPEDLIQDNIPERLKLHVPKSSNIKINSKGDTSKIRTKVRYKREKLVKHRQKYAYHFGRLTIRARKRLPPKKKSFLRNLTLPITLTLSSNIDHKQQTSKQIHKTMTTNYKTNKSNKPKFKIKSI